MKDLVFNEIIVNGIPYKVTGQTSVRFDKDGSATLIFPVGDGKILEYTMRGDDDG